MEIKVELIKSPVHIQYEVKNVNPNNILLSRIIFKVIDLVKSYNDVQ